MWHRGRIIEETEARNRTLRMKVAKLTQDLKDESREANAWEDFAEEYEDELQRTKTELASFQRDNTALRRTLANTEGLVSDFLPSLEFIGESTDHLLKSRDRKPIFRHLRQIHDRSESVKREKVKGVTGWFELRAAKRERVYFKRASGNRTYYILLGNKNSQKLDFEWISNN